MRSSDHEFADEFHALAELAEVMLQLVAALSERGATAVSAEQVVAVAERCMSHAEATALSVIVDGRLQTVASRGAMVAGIDAIRSDTEQGPSLDVIETSDVVVTGRLAADERWPTFGPRAHEKLGVASVATYRLYLGGPNRGALTFYSTWPDAFDELPISVGAIFAAYASLVLSHRLSPESRIPAGRAQSVHTEIGVAVGILLAGSGLSADEGYRRLHAASRELQMTLPETARHITTRGNPAVASGDDTSNA